METKTIHLEKGEIYYFISEHFSKDKKTLFFLHGLTADHTMFKEQVKHFKEKFNIILWDAPYHGKSKSFTDLRYDTCASLIKMILEKEGVDSCAFIGQSMGAFIIQALIKRYPEKVSAFVSIDGNPYGNSYYSAFDKFILRQMEWLSHLYPFQFLKKAMAKKSSLTETGYKNMMDMTSVYTKDELCHVLGEGFKAFLEDNCDLEILCPVLLIVGKEDKTGKVIQYNIMWSKNTGFELVFIENASHNSNVDNPERVNSEIETFLNRMDFIQS